MKKIKLFLIMFLLFIFVLSTKTTRASENIIETDTNFYFQEASTNKGKIKIYPTTIKVKNAEKVSAKLSKKIGTVKVKKNKIQIIFKKLGVSDLIIKSPGMEVKKIKLIIFKRGKKISESKIKNYMKGLSDFCKDDIEKYPYLDFKTYNDRSYAYKYSLNEQWKAMPSYLKDCLIAKKTKIKFKYGDDGIDGTCSNNGKIIIMYPKDDYGEKFAIIHESAHNFWFFMKNFNVDVTDKIKDEYESDRKKYGIYGSFNKDEFYAEKIQWPIINEIETKSYEILTEEIKLKCDPRPIKIGSEYTFLIPGLEIAKHGSDTQHKEYEKKLDERIKEIVFNLFKDNYNITMDNIEIVTGSYSINGRYVEPFNHDDLPCE